MRPKEAEEKAAAKRENQECVRKIIKKERDKLSAWLNGNHSQE